MNNQELYYKLQQAQLMLSDVYNFAVENKIPELASLMSCADTCINDAFEKEWNIGNE